MLAVDWFVYLNQQPLELSLVKCPPKPLDVVIACTSRNLAVLGSLGKETLGLGVKASSEHA